MRWPVLVNLAMSMILRFRFDNYYLWPYILRAPNEVGGLYVFPAKIPRKDTYKIGPAMPHRARLRMVVLTVSRRPGGWQWSDPGYCRRRQWRSDSWSSGRGIPNGIGPQARCDQRSRRRI